MLLPISVVFGTSMPYSSRTYPPQAHIRWEENAMSRFFLPLLVVVVFMATPWARTANAEGKLTAEVMKIALHTATPQEEGFIEYVLARVDKGALPLDLVQSTFLWAKKKSHKKFFYFKQGLILRTAERGIKL
jgi:hypothetical protein